MERANTSGVLDGTSARRPWDARLARRLVAPLADRGISPNHLTTARLVVGLLGSAAFLPGRYGWSNVGALLLVLSNFLDHADGELARMSGRTSRFGHIYDLASDALVTILIFVAIGVGCGPRGISLEIQSLEIPPVAIGAIAGCAIALIFYLRMRIEDMAGKAATRQGSLGGFETEDVLYLLPLATLCEGLLPLLIAASICAPLYLIWVIGEYRRVESLPRPLPVGGLPQGSECADSRRTQ
jgi:phosphatidylglycerophosphate synthase